MLTPTKSKIRSNVYKALALVVAAWLVGCAFTKTDPTKIYLLFSYPVGVFSIVMEGLGALAVGAIVTAPFLYVFSRFRKKERSFYSYLTWAALVAFLSAFASS